MFDHLSGNVLQRFWLYIPLCLLSCANPNVWFSVMKLTLMVKLRTLLSSHRPPLLEHPILPFVCSIALRKDPRRFWLHCHDYRHALKLMSQNSPWWWSCEWCNNFLSSFWPPLLASLLDTNSMDVMFHLSMESSALQSDLVSNGMPGNNSIT